MAAPDAPPPIPEQVATAGAAFMAALRRLLGRPPKLSVAQRQAEAAHGVELAARREAADEVIRATSRRVMNEMWPPKVSPPAAPPPSPPAVTSLSPSSAPSTPPSPAP